jgi:hypothetical protein
MIALCDRYAVFAIVGATTLVVKNIHDYVDFERSLTYDTSNFTPLVCHRAG